MPNSLPNDVRARLIETVRDRIMPRFGKGDRAQSDAARALGVSPGAISRLLKGEGGSITMIEAAAKYLNEEPTWILMGAEVKRGQPRRLRELPGFAQAMTDASRRLPYEHPGLDILALEEAADVRAEPEPKSITAALLVNIALAMRTPDSSPARSKTKSHRQH